MAHWTNSEKLCIARFYKKAKANKDQLYAAYDNSRRFLRCFSYGCYDIETLQEIIPCSRELYFAFQRLYRDILPEDRYISEKVAKKKRPAFRGDSYYGNENFLAETFRVKSLREPEIFFFLHLLPPLADARREKGLSAQELAPTLYLTYLFNKDTTTPEADALVPYLNQLADFGFVRTIPHGKRGVRYTLADDVFAMLSKDEAADLLFAVDYFKNTTFMSVPGYFLADTLCRKFDLDAKRLQPFHFTNLDIRRVLDDDIVYQVLCAIEKHDDLHIIWQHKDKKKVCDIRPQAILEDELGDGRRQLLTLPRNRRMRLEDMYELQLCDKPLHVAVPKEKRAEQTTISFLLHFETEAEKTRLLNHLQEEFPPVIFHDENEHSVHGSFHCVDPQKYLPLLRSFLPNIELTPQPKLFLFREMQQHINHALAKYDAPLLSENAQIYPTAPKQDKKVSARSPQESMFEEIHSGIYHWLVTTHNRLCHTADTPTMRTMIDQMPYGGSARHQLFARYLMAAFQFDLTSAAKNKIKENPKINLNPNDFVVVPPRKPIPILPTTLELRWLKTVLAMPEADFMLDTALKEKLLASLAHIRPFDLSAWRRQLNRKEVKGRTDVYESLKALIPALRKGYEIMLRTSVYTPLRLCQNVSTGIYQLLCWDFARHEPHWIHEMNFPFCSALTRNAGANSRKEAESNWQGYLGDASKKRSVTLSFYETCNMRERVYTVFSAFDKESHLDAVNECYHLTVFYRPFEEEDVLRRILSFGAYVTVLEPTAIRDEIVNRLRKAQELYGADAHTDQ